ncbi:hypothetical protein PI124_g6307 [Phytophthora idaei]|nr:hypothetical protein PI125_g6462 [Phytophthora idaei]KAG3160967.1 hypothetical protein PI126_g6647 [Phytophthora idaei]KAG3249034.1 hypothetical protein PI124_g6307 [Phytophthora idaei]
MTQSRSLRGRSATGISRIFTGPCQDGTDSSRQDEEGNYFVAEDDGFLDAVAAALDQLAADCKTALRWSHDDADADAAILAAEQSFCTIAAVCKDAGLTVATDVVGSHHDLTARDHTYSTPDAFATSLVSVNTIGEFTSSWTHTPANDDACQPDANCKYPPPVPIQRKSLSEAIPRSTEEIVEVELTDLLTQSHEKMLSLKRVFEARMAKAEQSREESEHRHANEMQALQEELASSRFAMDRIKHELLNSTSRKLEDMHSAITASQKVIEAGMKDQTRYWKSICEELVVEKREMAQKVAEERGRYTALKAHLVNHDDTGTRPPSHGRVRIRSTHDKGAASKIHMCDLSPSASPTLGREFASGNQGSNGESTTCVSTCSTPTDPSSMLAVVPSADIVSNSSSVEVSPTHSNCSSTSSKSTFRRYYLAQKRDNRVVLH